MLYVLLSIMSCLCVLTSAVRSVRSRADDARDRVARDGQRSAVEDERACKDAADCYFNVELLRMKLKLILKLRFV